MLFQASDHASSSPPPVADGRAAAAPRPAVIAARCSPAQARALRRAYEEAYALARAAAAYVHALPTSPRRRIAGWNAGPAGRLFGPFTKARARRVARTLALLLQRFARGYETRDGWRPVVLDCFPDRHRRCGQGLLGNASIYGRLRLCPRVLQRPGAAAVVLHELLHRGLGVDDQRHESCAADRKQRCYRDAGAALPEAGRPDLAVRNIDNYVLFAREVAAYAKGAGR